MKYANKGKFMHIPNVNDGVHSAHKVKCAVKSILALLVVLSTAAQAVTLKDIQFSGLPGNKVQIEMVLDAAPTSLKSFSTDNPARVAIDLSGVNNAAGKKTMPINIGKAISVRALEAGDRTRVVLNLSESAPYTTKVVGNSVFLTLGDLSSSSSVVEALTPLTNNKSVRGIDFRRGESGEGRVLVELTSTSAVVDVKQEAGKVLVEIKDTMLPLDLANRLNVIDFATPVKTIDVTSSGSDTRLAITPVGVYEFLSYQVGELLTVEFKPLTKQEEDRLAAEKFPFTGEKLSLNFQSIEVRSVLQLLADFTDMNLVASDSVGGSVTLRLNNVPWDQALDIILKSKGLAKRITGNVMMVGPQAEVAAQEKLELEAKKQVIELSPLMTEFFEVSYAKAEDLESLIIESGNNSNSSGGSLISSRGSVATDLRTNTLIVQETREKLVEVRELIKRLDKPVRQVMVEARIVIASDNYTRELGVNLGLSGIDYQNADDGRNIGEPVFRADDIFVSLPLLSGAAATAGANFTIGRIGSTLLDLELSALQIEGDGEILSSPRVVTSNQQEAIISQGLQIPYPGESESGGVTIDFKDALIELKVTPLITPDDKVSLELNISKDEADTSTSPPGINKQEVQTSVLVDNGETVILGGVFEKTKTMGVSKVPFFGDIPVVGVLFKNQTKIDLKRELLFFITPKILKDSLSAD